MKKLIFLLLGAVTVIFTACNNKSDNNSVNAATRYSYINGSCYDSTTAQYVQPMLCQQAASQYTWGANGTCVSTINGQPVQPTLCQQANNGYYMMNGACYNQYQQQVNYTFCQQTTMGGTATQCYGNYLYMVNGVMQPATCAGANCRGYTLIEQSTGRTVTCQ